MSCGFDKNFWTKNAPIFFSVNGKASEVFLFKSPQEKGAWNETNLDAPNINWQLLEVS
jgi:hypothetical protein